MPNSHLQSRPATVKTDQAPNPIRVLVSTQQRLVRAGIRALLDRVEDLKVGEVADRHDILTSIEAFNPHVVLLELTTPGLVGLEFLKLVVQKFSSTRVIALPQHENEEHAVQALHWGAAGLIDRSAESPELELAIKTVVRGEVYISKRLKSAVRKYSDSPRPFLSELTARQYQVLKLMADGHSTKQIARRLNISGKTVEAHRAQLMERLDIRDVPGLVRYALRIGLIRLDD